MGWLNEARKRYGLTILNYIATSNHIHLLVLDRGDREVISRSMQLVSGRTAQAYNSRKKRKGAFWEDRYHATAVESDHHLISCLTYIDLNMVRAGVAAHPSDWEFGGYAEMLSGLKREEITDRSALMELLRIGSFDGLREMRKQWVEEALVRGLPGAGRHVDEERCRWEQAFCGDHKDKARTESKETEGQRNGRQIRSPRAASAFRSQH